ncbi:MAG: 3-oxoacyl-ACP reductase FabG [Oscillatoria sp. PMC 1068.18]|nr:3-oxoacyl-ACP reductase FabG [Oscillatoria sp. PMC 1076.18]MEC4989986.1 3-oxoacyl-ACP reductase FabG [Oscillatoria sp. PMC 1068.18]
MQDKQVLLTGGTGGLGLEVTPALLAKGAKLTVTYIHQEQVKRLQKKLNSQEFASIRFVDVNLFEEKAVAQLINDMERVDVLIHLVGGFAMGKVSEYSYEDWRQDFDLNLNTTFLVCKYSLQKMLEYGYGRIVTVGSRGAVQPGANLAAYSASKAGVAALTQAIAAETKGLDITANCVLPSVIDTPANRETMGEEDADKWVKPESLAEVICFLASEAARDLRGALVPVYGEA